jgi:hypothetical protein
MGEWSGRTGRLSGIGKFDEIENLGIIFFYVKSPRRVGAGLKRRCTM